MTVTDIINYASSELSLVKRKSKVYVISDYRLGNEEFDYGIYTEIDEKELTEGKFNADVIPDIFCDDMFNDIREQLTISYNVSDSDVEKLKNIPYSDWYDKLIEFGYTDSDISPILKDICDIFTGRKNYDPEVVTNKGTQEEKDAIDKYRALWEY